MIHSYGQLIGKVNTFVTEFKSYEVLLGEFKDKLKEYWELSDTNFVIKREQDEGVEHCDLKELITMPSHLGGFLISNGKNLLKDFET